MLNFYSKKRNKIDGKKYLEIINQSYNKTPLSLSLARQVKDKNITLEDINNSAKFYIDEAVEGKKILDAGSGGGTLSVMMEKLNASVYSTDIGYNCIQELRNLIDNRNNFVSNLEYIPLKDNQFDIVCSIGVIHYAPDTHKAFNELVRVLKPGGILFTMLYNKHSLYNYIKPTMRYLYGFKIFQNIIIKAFLWVAHRSKNMKTAASLEEIFMDNFLSPPSRQVTKSTLRKWAKENNLEVVWFKPRELASLYFLGDRVTYSKYLKKIENIFGWNLHAKFIKK